MAVFSGLPAKFRHKLFCLVCEWDAGQLRCMKHGDFQLPAVVSVSFQQPDGAPVLAVRGSRDVLKGKIWLLRLYLLNGNLELSLSDKLYAGSGRNMTDERRKCGSSFSNSVLTARQAHQEGDGYAISSCGRSSYRQTGK